MKIASSYIVRYEGKLQVLYVTDSGEYFVSSNGAFGQRETYLEQISGDMVNKLTALESNKNTDK